MNKAILIIDMPSCCDECPLFHGFYTDMTCGANNYGINYPYPKDFRQDWCPLKPIADRVEVFMDDWAEGCNICLEDILKNKS